MSIDAMILITSMLKKESERMKAELNPEYPKYFLTWEGDNLDLVDYYTGALNLLNQIKNKKKV